MSQRRGRQNLSRDRRRKKERKKERKNGRKKAALRTHHSTSLLRLRVVHLLILLPFLLVTDHESSRSVRRSDDLDLSLGSLDQGGLAGVGEGGGEDGLNVRAWEGEDGGGVEIDGGFGVEGDLSGDFGEGDRGWVGEDAVKRGGRRGVSLGERDAFGGKERGRGG